MGSHKFEYILNEFLKSIIGSSS